MKIFTSLMVATLSLAYFNNASADILIDLNQLDEISISNTQPDNSFSERIAEPELANDLVNQQPASQLAGTTKPANKTRLRELPFNVEVLAAAKETLVDAALIHAVIATESRHNAKAVSNKGARGLMQLMPATAKRFNVKDRNNAGQNILAGSRYLRELLNLYKGDLQLSLAAYNAGPGAVAKYHGRIPPYQETLHYVPKVLNYYRQYS